MSTTTLIEKPDTTQHAAIAWAPARLDVHHLPELDAWNADHTTGGSREQVLDCSAVAFVDQAAIEAILSAERDPQLGLRIARPSTAMRITFELLGHTMNQEPVAA